MVVEGAENACNWKALNICDVSHDILAFSGADQCGNSVNEVFLPIHGLQLPISILGQHLIVVLYFVVLFVLKFAKSLFILLFIDYASKAI